MVEKEVWRWKSEINGETVKNTENAAKSFRELVLYIGYIFRRYIVTVGRLICNLHSKVNILGKRDLSVHSAYYYYLPLII